MIKKIGFYITFIFLFAVIAYSIKATNEKNDELNKTTEQEESCSQLYNEMGLGRIIRFDVFKKAYSGYRKIDVKNRDILTVIDYSRPSTEKRLYVLDLKNKKLLFESHVSHGRNSGGNYATSFSNKPGSYKSSPGFYVTENTYQGKNGYSLVLDGLEKGINDKAKERAIVMHGADYCNPSFISSGGGRLGRSLGCPAVPRSVCNPIINTIKDGTLLYIHVNDNEYLTKSEFTSPDKVNSHYSTSF